MIRIMSCNLQGGRASASALQEIIESEAIDVVCAQELSIELAEALAAVLPFSNMQHDRIQRANGIAARHPVRISPLRLPARDAWAALLEPDSWPSIPRALEIVNVHISAPHTWPYFPRGARRREQIDLLLQNRSKHLHRPHAVVGDFNASPIWPVYKKMLELYSDGMLLAAGKDGGPKPTWPYFPLLGLRGLIRIDHMFLRQLSARNSRIVEIPGTDHLGIILDLVVNQTDN